MKNPLTLAFLGLSCLLANGCDSTIEPTSPTGNGDSIPAARNEVPNAALQLVVGGDAVADHMDPDGRDWFRFQADSGRRYNILFPTLPSRGVGFACQMDVSGPQLSNEEARLCVNVDIDEEPQPLLATRTGAVYIRIASFGVEDTGAYSIAVELDTVGIDAWEPDDDRTHATPLPTDGVEQSHALPVSDHDWCRIAVQAGKGYKVTTHGAGVWALTLHQDSPYGDSVVRALEPSSPNSARELFFNAARSGDVWVEVEGFDSSYTISAVVDTMDRDAFEPDDLRERASSIGVSGEMQTHSLRIRDVDFVRFHADSGATYTVSAAFRGEGGKLSLQVLDIDDTVWTRTIPGPDGIRMPTPQNAVVELSTEDSTSFKAKWTRDFLVKIQGASSSVRGAYDLRVRRN